MGANIIKVCILVGLLQGRSCGLIDIFVPNIQALEKDVSAMVSSGPAFVSNIESNLTSIISSANGTIGNVVNDLEAAVSNIVNLTEHLGKDIDSCVQNLNSALINLNLQTVLAPCVPNLNTSGILGEILDLGAKIRSPETAGISCVTDDIFRPWNIKMCLDAIVADIRSDFSHLSDQFEAITILPALTQSCVTTAIEDVISNVSSIQKDFEECVAEVVQSVTTHSNTKSVEA